MRKIKDILLAVLIIGLLISATVPASWVKQVFPFGVQIKGDLQVDSTLYLVERTAGTSDSVLVLEDGIVKYNTSAAGTGDTALWGKNSAYLYTLPQTTRVGIGTGNTPQVALHIVDSTGSLGINPYMYSATAGQYPSLNFGKFNGLPSDYDALATSTYMGAINFAGTYNTSSTSIGGRISLKTSEAWDTDNRGTTMTFSAIAIGNNSFTDVLTLYDGKVGVLNVTPDSAVDVTGGMSVSTDILVGGGWQTWSPTITWTGGTPSAPDQTVARYSITNNTVTYTISFWGTNDSGATLTSVTVSLPVTPKDVNMYPDASCLYNSSAKSSNPNDRLASWIDCADATAGNRIINTIPAGFSVLNLGDYLFSFTGHYEITTK